jgi:hypothetical protein
VRCPIIGIVSLLTNIGLAQKLLPRTNTLAYFALVSAAKQRSFQVDMSSLFVHNAMEAKKNFDIDTWGQSYKTFYGHNIRIFIIISMSVNFQSMLPTNIGLGWKGLPVTNTLAYYENL